MSEKRQAVIESSPVRVVTINQTSPRVINVNAGRVIVAEVADTQRQVVINNTMQRQAVISPPVVRTVAVSTPTVRVISIGIQGPQGAGGSGGSGLIYSVQDGPDYQAAYVYVGYETSTGEWYIYRRTYVGNARMYASGNSGYGAAWTNRTGQVYV